MDSENPFVEWDEITRDPMPKTVQHILLAGWAIKQQIDQLNRQLRQINESLAAEFCGARLEIPGHVSVDLAPGNNVSISDIGALRLLLREEFSNYVKTSIHYSASEELKNIARDPDHVLFPLVDSCVEVRGRRPSIRWTAAH